MGVGGAGQPDARAVNQVSGRDVDWARRTDRVIHDFSPDPGAHRMGGGTARRASGGTSGCVL
jgi:hypothetical protein